MDIRHTGATHLVRQTAKGPAVMLVSALLFAVLGFLIKILGPSFRVWDIAVYRFGGSALVLNLSNRNKKI